MSLNKACDGLVYYTDPKMQNITFIKHAGPFVYKNANQYQWYVTFVTGQVFKRNIVFIKSCGCI